MAFKFVVLAALVACANAGYLSGPAAIGAPLLAAPVARQVLTKVTDAEYDPHPQYSYSYNVADSITGDFKHQAETRDGDVVRGSYSLLESDGTRRVVDYAADALSGFNAVVRKEPATVAVAAPAPVAVKTTIAAPAAIAAPAFPAPAAIAAPAAFPAAFPAPAAYAAPAAFPAPAAFAAPAAFSAPITRFAAPLPAAALPVAAAPAALPFPAAAALPYAASAFPGYAAPAGIFRSSPIVKSFY